MGARHWIVAALLASGTGVAMDAQAHAAPVDAIAVSGTVTNAMGSPLEGVNVNVNALDGSQSTGAQTDADGHYTTGTLPPGAYRVQFSDSHYPQQWATEFWDDKYVQNDATVLTLAGSDGAVHSGIDAQLAQAATVTGTVTDATTHAGLDRICVYVAVDTDAGLQGVAYGSTSSDGTYSIGGLPPIAVKVGFDDCNGTGPYARQFWNGQGDVSSATTLQLAEGSTSSGIDGALTRAAAIRGTVTSGGAPAKDICVQASTATFVGGLTRSDDQGHYSLAVAKAGDYKVQFVDCRQTPTLAGQWWHGASSSKAATTVAVATGQIVTGIDADMVAGATGSISGKVTNKTGAGMTTACVVAYMPNQYALFAQIHSDGTYTVPNVPAGTYALAFVGCGGNQDASPIVVDPVNSADTYAAVWWKGVPLQLQSTGDGGPDPIAQGAVLVAITPGDQATGYDWCFGCTDAPLSVKITGVVRAEGAITVSFKTKGSVTGQTQALADPTVLQFTVTCTSPTGTTGSATGASSPITVTGLTAGAAYSCTVVASDGRSDVAASPPMSSIIASAPPATLPATGTPTGLLTLLGLWVLVTGGVLASIARRHRPTKS